MNQPRQMDKSYIDSTLDWCVSAAHVIETVDIMPCPMCGCRPEGGYIVEHSIGDVYKCTECNIPFVFTHLNGRNSIPTGISYGDG